MSTKIYWFRNDLRLLDSPALIQACRAADHLVPVFVLPPTDVTTQWGFARASALRQGYLRDTLSALDQALRNQGSALIILRGDAVQALNKLASTIQADSIFCEQIAAPEEQTEVDQLRQLGLNVQEHWQSTMLDLDTLPVEVKAMPDMFTAFRQKIEKHPLRARPPFAAPEFIPPLPAGLEHTIRQQQGLVQETNQLDATSESNNASTAAGTVKGLKHLDHYFSGEAPHTYKQTRNQLSGTDFSTNFSPWLASGALSAPMIVERLTQYESVRGANDSTYWIWFELLWRDYFRFIHLKYGRLLYRRSGLKDAQSNCAVPFLATPMQGGARKVFEQWMLGQTPNALVNSGMNELRTTGRLSNRMRQIVASYLIYDLKIDWRAGAAWFESQLLDFDIYSNQGNWLYIAGLGTDPRGGRRMNMDKQAQDHDPQGRYRAQWS